MHPWRTPGKTAGGAAARSYTGGSSKRGTSTWRHLSVAGVLRGGFQRLAMRCRRSRRASVGAIPLLGALATVAFGGGPGVGCAQPGHHGDVPGDDGGGAGGGSGGGSGSGSGGGSGSSGGGAVDAGQALAPPCPTVGLGTSVFNAACNAGAPTVNWSPMRRISRAEYNNMVRDLLGDSTQPAGKFVSESPLAIGVNFLANTCTGVGASDTYIPQQYLEAAEALAQAAVADTNSLSNLLARSGVNAACATQGDACAQAFVSAFANRAFRGQFDATEGTSLFKNVYSPIQTQFDFATGIQAVITSVLTSPRFLYVLEFGQTNASGKVVALSPYELATRLSLFLWRSLPDDPLLQAAANNQLSTPDQIRAQAVRMLTVKDPTGHIEAQGALDDFVTQWMELENAGSITRDSQYKAWNGATGLSSELRGETLATFHSTVLQDNGSLTALLTSPQSYVNNDVMTFYTTPPASMLSVQGCTDTSIEGACFKKQMVNSASNPRAGILTQPIVLAAQSHTTFPSPTLRGKLVREQLLCDPVYPPPAGLNIPPPPTSVAANQTIKDKYAAHEQVNTVCSGCHSMMDKIGDGFGVYDATGIYQTTEVDGQTGGPFSSIDPSGLVQSGGTGEFTTSFTGPVDLITKLANAPQVQQCFALQEFRYALSRVENPVDACSLKQIEQAFSSSQLNIQQLLLAIVQSDAFRYRTVENPGSACQ